MSREVVAIRKCFKGYIEDKCLYSVLFTVFITVYNKYTVHNKYTYNIYNCK